MEENKHSNATNTLSIIMLTAKEGGKNLVKAFTEVVDDYLNKPFNVDGKQIMVTASIGVCTHSKNENEPTMEMLLKCADEKRYQAKDGERNQVVF